MRRDWAGPAQTKSRAEKSVGGALLRGEAWGDGCCTRGQAGYNLHVLRARQDGGLEERGAAPVLGRTICWRERGGRWRITSGNYRALQLRLRSALSDQLQPSLKPSLDFDLLEGVYSRGKKGNSGRNRGGCKQCKG